MKIEDRAEHERKVREGKQAKLLAEKLAKQEELQRYGYQGTGENEEEPEEEEEEPTSYLQSRLNLPAVYIRSICQHANMRLLMIDKSTRATTGVSTYVFERKE